MRAGRDRKLREAVEDYIAKAEKYRIHSELLFASSPIQITVDMLLARDVLRELLAVPDPLASSSETQCPHGEDCACSIATRHEWHVAFCEERERLKAASSVPVRASGEPQKRPTFRARATLEQIYVLLTGALVRETKREREHDLAEARSVCEQSFKAAAELDAWGGASASPSDDGARQPPLRALINALAVLEGCCGADDRTAAYAVAGAARAYVDSLPAASAEIESLKAPQKLEKQDYALIAEAVEDFLGFDITTREQQDRITRWASASPSDDGAVRERLASWLEHLAGVQRNLPLDLTEAERLDLKHAARFIRR